MDQVEDRICDLDARGSEEADNLANDRDLDRFILTGNSLCRFGKGLICRILYEKITFIY